MWSSGIGQSSDCRPRAPQIKLGLFRSDANQLPPNGDEVDLTLAIVAILALNAAVFLAGCLLAAYRTWVPSARARRHRHENGGGVRH